MLLCFRSSRDDHGRKESREQEVKNFAETRGQRMGLKTSVMIHRLSFLLINMCEWKRSCILTRVRDARRRRGFRKFGNVKKLYTENELKDTRAAPVETPAVLSSLPACLFCLPAFSACLAAD